MSETISRHFTFLKLGVFYFSRRIPKDLRSHYKSSRIAYSLRTRMARIAETRARKAAEQLDEYWFHLGCRDKGLLGKHLLRMLAVAGEVTGHPSPSISSASVRLSEAVRIYLDLNKGKGRPATFHWSAERACGYVVDACGDQYLDAYTKKSRRLS